MPKMLSSPVPAWTLSLFLAFSGRAQVRITEFMASNTGSTADEDGAFSDWVEIQNTTATNVNLLNWALTDSAGNASKWLFPATNLAPGNFLLVFASGKDRRIAGLPLHTNFKLDAAGEYLALNRPNGTTASKLAPYPPQYPDVSYGIGMQVSLIPALGLPPLYPNALSGARVRPSRSQQRSPSQAKTWLRSPVSSVPQCRKFTDYWKT